MNPYGKTAQTAVAAVSRLAQLYDPAKPVKLSSLAIARDRRLPQPVVAKVLTVLSQAGIVRGSPGPGGGYSLAKAPGEITLYDVARHFDRLQENLSCPFGPQWCGSGPHCPMHAQFGELLERAVRILRSNTFMAFVNWDPKTGDPARAAVPNAGLSLNVLPARQSGVKTNAAIRKAKVPS